MASHVWLPVALVLLPFVGALLAFAATAFSPGREKPVVLACAIAVFVLAARLLVAVSLGESIALHIPLPLALGLQLNADYLAAFMALVTALVMLPVLLFSWDFVPVERGRCEYFAVLNALCGALMGVIFSRNLAWIFFFMEIVSLCLWRLALLRRGERDMENANRMLAADAAGSLLFLLGTVIVYVDYGSPLLDSVKGEFVSVSAVLALVAALFAKAGLLPFSSRLEAAGAGMPATAGALACTLSGAVCGAYLFARIFCVPGRLGPAWEVAIIFSAGIGALVSSGAALIENNMRRALACLAAACSGMAFMGLATMTKAGVGGGLLCLLVYPLAGTGLFLCSDIAQQRAGGGDMARMGGMYGVLPFTAAAFAVCGAAVMGLPPFGGFFCQLLLFKGMAAFSNPVLFVIMTAAFVMQALVLPRVFYLVFLGADKTPQPPAPGREAVPTQLASLAFVAGVCLLAGLLVYYPAHYIEELCLQLGVTL